MTMDVIVTADRRFNRTPDGRVWTTSSSDLSFWRRYLDVFDHVHVLARIVEVPKPEPTWKPATGEGVSMLAVPSFVGPSQFLSRYPAFRAACRRAAAHDAAFVLRTPGHVSAEMDPVLYRHGRPFAVEVVGDPYEAYAPNAIDHPLRRYMRWLFVHRLRRQCAHACAASYVTEHTLQKRYPPGERTFATHYSSASLRDDSFAVAPRRAEDFGSPLRLVSVGTMALGFKGYDLLIAAVRDCQERGLDVTLTLIGSGRHRPTIERGAEDADGRIRFLGELPGPDAVRAVLAQSDLFVHPSKTEGLPRVVIEAMAQALPCIATSVGGTAELLPAEDMVPPGDVKALAAAIRSIALDRRRLSAMSARNLATSRGYAESVLALRRQAMYRHLRQCVEDRRKR